MFMNSPRRGRLAAAVFGCGASVCVSSATWSQEPTNPATATFQVPGGQYDYLVVEPYGMVLKKYTWKTTQIPVCWDEDPVDAEEARLRTVVQLAVEDSWQRYSALKFEGWSKCATKRQMGVHILVRDSLPRTNGIGSYVNGRYGAVVLNFQLSKWRPACQSQDSKDDCIRYLAVHEFGHVLGFVHENVRDDTPRECRSEAGTHGARGDWKVTTYDPYSIMNYCSSKWTLYSASPKPPLGLAVQVLSARDREAVRIIYGAPNQPGRDTGLALR